jgi:predicted AlkP superfamily pyrophosphatase or phosphodiesterase
MRHRRSPVSLFSLSLLSLLSLGSFFSCRTAPPPPPQEPRRVVLLSLDGASTEDLHRLWRDGALTAGGFRQFFEKGEVAERLVPVNPTLTAVNHISLATGAVPGQTGIVSNSFHPADAASFVDRASGFDAPIGTETLWEAGKRQGKRVGIVTWPGADGKGPKRTADWGMIYVNDAATPPDLAVLARTDWAPADPADPRLREVRSFAPVLRAALPQRGIDLAAIDRQDDGRTAYDALVPLGQGEQDRPVLAAGDWGSFSWTSPGGAVPAWIKILAIAPDLSSTRVYLNGVFANASYPETFSRELAESGLLWPGPPDDRRLSDSWQGRPGIDLATWIEQSERFTGFFGAALRFAAARDDWDLLMGYIPTIDEAGHQLLLTDERQPGFSPDRRDEFAAARVRVWQAVDRELAALLRVLDLRETLVVIVSDHGMLPVHTAVDPNVLLRDQALLATEGGRVVDAGTAVHAISSGASSHVYLRPGDPDRARIVAGLRTRFTDWTVEGGRPIARVLTREEAGSVGLDHPNSGDLILFAAPGYTFHGGGLRDGRAAQPTMVLGMHGHLAGEPSLDGIWLALGPGVEKGSAGAVRTVDVAHRVAAWLGMELGSGAP